MGSLTGATTASASALLSNAIELEAPPEIKLLPEFIPWRWLPRRADRISIRLAGPASLLPPEDEPAASTATPAPEETETPEAADETVNADGDSG